MHRASQVRCCRELDYVPSEFRYVLPQPLTPQSSTSLSRHNSMVTNPLNKTLSGPFTSFSQENFKKVTLSLTPAQATVLKMLRISIVLTLLHRGCYSVVASQV